MKEPQRGSGSAVFLCCHPLLRRPSLTAANCWAAALLVSALPAPLREGAAVGLCCGLCCSHAGAAKSLMCLQAGRLAWNADEQLPCELREGSCLSWYAATDWPTI